MHTYKSRTLPHFRYISPEVIKGCGHSSAVDWWCVGVLTYEMMFGTTPFKGPNRHATFSNVLRNDVGFPDQPTISQLAKHIIRKLLIKDEIKRLGSQSGASEVKSHKWFAPITWGLLRNTRPPIVPSATVRLPISAALSEKSEPNIFLAFSSLPSFPSHKRRTAWIQFISGQ